MTRATLLHVLERPTALGPAEVRELEQLAQAFPYCQTAHLLLAKAAHDQGTMLAGQRLRRAATYAADRTLLRRLIEQEEPAEQVAAPEPIAEPVALPAPPHPLDLVDWPDEYVAPTTAPPAGPARFVPSSPPAPAAPPAAAEAPAVPAEPVAETPAVTEAPAVAASPVLPAVADTLSALTSAEPAAIIPTPAPEIPVTKADAPVAAPVAEAVPEIVVETPAVAEPLPAEVAVEIPAETPSAAASQVSAAAPASAPLADVAETVAPVAAPVITVAESVASVAAALASVSTLDAAEVAPLPAAPAIDEPVTGSEAIADIPAADATPEAELPPQAPAIRPPVEAGEARFEFGLADPAPVAAVPVYELPGLVDEWAASAVTRSLGSPEALAAPLPALAPPVFTPAAFTGDAVVGYAFGESSRLGLSMQLLDLLAAKAEAAETVTAVVAAAQPPATSLPPAGTFFEPDPLLLDHWATHRPVPPELPSTIDLINNFLKRQPRLTRPAMLPPAPGGQADLSVRSTRAEPDLVSENLARIFVRQGKTARAIEIYEKLMVKQPEKMAYFAAQIQSLQPSA